MSKKKCETNKNQYDTRQQAQIELRRLSDSDTQREALGIYQCEKCNSYHIGHCNKGVARAIKLIQQERKNRNAIRST